jgi:branched-chain amino acid transport system permease protein
MTTPTTSPVLATRGGGDQPAARNGRAGLITLLVVAAALVAYPLVVTSSFALTVGVLALTTAVAATGWNILGGYCGQLSFGHALYWSAGMYGTALAVGAGWSPWEAMPVCAAVAASLAVALGWPSFRLRGHQYAISTFAIAVVAVPIVTSLQPLGAAQGLSIPLRPLGLWTLQFSPRDPTPYYNLALALFAVVTAITALFLRGRTGSYLRAIRDDEDAAAAIGIPVRAYKLRAAAVSAAVTAVAGSYQVMTVLLVDPSTLDPSVSTSIAVCALLGGAGSMWGPLVGSWVVIAAQEYTRTYAAVTGRSTDLLLYGALLVAVATVERRGLVGLAARVRRATLRRPATSKEDQ